MSETLLIAVSSRALFNLEGDHKLFSENGLQAFADHQREMDGIPFSPGPAFPMVRGLLALNRHVPAGKPPFVEVVVVSSQHPDTGLRVFSSIQHHGLAMTRAVFTGGASSVPYLRAFGAALLLTKSEKDAQAAIDMGIPAAVMYDLPADYRDAGGDIRIAFDGDAVIFSDESEVIYKRDGLQAFLDNETANALVPMPEGPYCEFLRGLGRIRQAAPNSIRIALVTARDAPSHERALRTLRGWGLDVDEAFFLGGLKKAPFLKEFGCHIFLDDQDAHLLPASAHVPSGRVPYRTRKDVAATGELSELDRLRFEIEWQASLTTGVPPDPNPTVDGDKVPSARKTTRGKPS